MYVCIMICMILEIYMQCVCICMQVKELKRSIDIPTISRTPGAFDGAQFNLHDILEHQIRKVV